MFTGHFGASFGLKGAGRTVSLGWLFFAAQYPDILWSILVSVGVEKASIVPGITAASPLDLTYYPFSHSLMASLIWAGAAYALVRLNTARRGSKSVRDAAVIGAAILSHFLFDAITHRPDLPILMNQLDGYKIGLGLWNYAIPSFIVENLIFFAGLAIYLRSTTSMTQTGRYGIILYSLFLVAMNVASIFMPLSLQGLLASVLLLNLLSVCVAFWLDAKRKPRSKP